SSAFFGFWIALWLLFKPIILWAGMIVLDVIAPILSLKSRCAAVAKRQKPIVNKLSARIE
ncbi:MAG: hypothetical protein U1B83_07300, partial [Candidatus Cloacimonadaceae bacterium]|nr:hypothetical protein [Candidatus Cloacimonadaceae bacterium]